jgi:hypothetical protein
MNYLRSLYPIAGGTMRIEETLILYQAWTLAQAPRVLYSRDHCSPYLYPSKNAAQYIGICQLDYSLSYNPIKRKKAYKQSLIY